MKRRNAIKLVASSYFIVTLPSGILGQNKLIPEIKKEEIIWAPLLGYVGSFCFSVGTTVVASLISEYLKRKFLDDPITCSYPAPTYLDTSKVKRENTRMEWEGYSDLNNSKVYQNNEIVTYPATKFDNYVPDKLDVQIPVFNQKTSTPICSMKGADLVGLGLVTNETANYRGSDFARQYLQPNIGVQTSKGSFQNGHYKSLNYKSVNGTNVEIDYRKKPYSQNEGMVKVIASNGYNRLIDREYNILFT